jgi:hypothetical protein
MLDLPPSIVQANQEAATRDDVPVEQRPHYVRWLRYCLDFCRKYGHDPEVADSLRPFEDKLIETRETLWER